MVIEESIPYQSVPMFLTQSKGIYNVLKSMSIEQLKQLYKANDKITLQNFERIQQYECDQLLTPAIFSYVGIQYKYMAPGVLENSSLMYLQQHLYILSALYGVLRPFDGIITYRLEAQASLMIDNKTIYQYFNESIATLISKEDYIINLASDEYYQMIKPNLNTNTKVIHIKFYELVNGKLKTKATDAKMARGRMVQFMANNNVEDIHAIKQFNELHFTFDEALSNETTYIFIKQP